MLCSRNLSEVVSPNPVECQSWHLPRGGTECATTFGRRKIRNLSESCMPRTKCVQTDRQTDTRRVFMHCACHNDGRKKEEGAKVDEEP
eukprot:1611523-Amphidinium_carterae.1